MSDTATGRHLLPDGDDHHDEQQPTEVLPPATSHAVPDEQVTCPECGTVAMVALTRRESTDFCVQCDYPLFWTPSKVVLDTGASETDSLRRLPGTAGRVTVGSLACPHCTESNLLDAEVCTRCGGLMHPPAPEPVVVAPPPPPPPAPEPARTPWWVWALGGVTLLLLVALVVFFLQR